jgi:hypothetical protein
LIAQLDTARGRHTSVMSTRNTQNKRQAAQAGLA